MYVVVDLPGIKAVQNTSGVCGLGSLSFPCNSACDPADDGTPPNGCATCCPSSSSSQVDDFNFDTFDPFDGFDTCVGVPTPWASWTNAIGQFIVKRACLVIGGQVVSVLYSDFLFMWEELAGKPGKRLTEMIGKRYTRAQLISDSSETRRLYIPLPFWFTKTSGNALPLISLQFHGVQVHVLFEDLINCIQVSSCDVMVLKCDNCQPITANDLSARLLTTYVYLDIHERDRFATGSFEQLIDQVQQCNTQANSSVVRMQLTFNHPIIELLWCVKRRKMVTSNNHFNYSGKWGKDPVQWVHLRLNGLPRFAAREGRYFRLVEPFQYHTLIPDSFTYCFSFALFPEEANPSGSMNSSRIDNIELILELQPDLFDGDDGPESVQHGQEKYSAMWGSVST